MSIELIKDIIGKECIITILDDNKTKKECIVLDIKDNWLKLNEKGIIKYINGIAIKEIQIKNNTADVLIEDKIILNDDFTGDNNKILKLEDNAIVLTHGDY